MNDKLKSFLNQHDSAYQSAKKISSEGEASSNYEEISDGNYVAQIVGMGWRDYQNKDAGGWSGMGPIMRLRIVGTDGWAGGTGTGESRFKGWKEDVVFFLFNHHPDKGIHQPQLNEKKLAFLTGQMRRLGIDCPQSLGDLPDWSEPMGMFVKISIKTRKDGERVYRNVYLNGTVHGATETQQDFPLESYVEQQWVPFVTQQAPQSAASNAAPPINQDTEIPF